MAVTIAILCSGAAHGLSRQANAASDRPLDETDSPSPRVIPLLVVAGAVVLASVLLNVAAYAGTGADEGAGRRRPKLRDHLATPGFVFECAATALAVACALVPARAAAGPTGERGTVVLLWSPLVPRGVLRVLRRRLHAHGWRTLVAAARFRGATPSEADERLSRTIDTQIPPGTPLAILGFGAGGLIARAYAAGRAGQRPLRLITLGTPHQGTRAKLATAVLRPGSDYLKTLATLDRPRRAFDAIAIYSDFDAWAQTSDDAFYPGAFNIEVRGVGHLSMLFSGRVAGLVLENLAAPLPGTPQ